MNQSSTVAMISLGCPKNLVNSEEMLALLQDAGYLFTDDLTKADAVIINTCAFIESAKTEAIEKILFHFQLSPFSVCAQYRAA